MFNAVNFFPYSIDDDGKVVLLFSTEHRSKVLENFGGRYYPEKDEDSEHAAGKFYMEQSYGLFLPEVLEQIVDDKDFIKEFLDR